MEPLFHIARAADWAQAQRAGTYRVSTLHRSLEEEGFIHLSFARQVKGVADAFYRNAGELVLLELDPARLGAPVRIEAVAGSSERFPHLYGPLDPTAVLAVREYAPLDEGGYPPVLHPLSAAWERHAEQWLAWARTPGHDVYHWELNLPAFADLVPAPGRGTLDLGCGEGRLGRWLAERGHRVSGIDASPTLVRHAAQAGGYAELVCGDALSLPWPAAAFDLAVAYMSLHDMAEPERAIAELARVLEPGGVLCVAIVHPLNRPPEHLEAYFAELPVRDTVTRGSLTMTFEGFDRPLETYTRALAGSGFVIEALREPCAGADAIARHPELAPAARRPYFLHMRCRLAT